MTLSSDQRAASRDGLRALGEVCAAFLTLGASSFGGPVAHLGYLRAECVSRRGWLDDDEFADTVALCQFLPGPSSSQVVFALGMRRAGLAGALAASACFLLPSAALMTAFAYGVAALGDLRAAGWLHGLKLASVAVVAQAVWSMGVRLCPDRARVTLALAAAALSLVRPGPLTQVGVLAAGALVGWRLGGRAASPPSDESGPPRGHLAAVAALAVFAALLLVPGLVATATGSRPAALFAAFYRPGALVFGGGHVVLPLLREAVVPAGWVGDEAFLAGYGAAQAVPGPLFSFAAYLGTLAGRGRHAWATGLWCLLAVFLPGWLLIGGAMPFWRRLRAATWAQAALRGANAAVVGVLLAALYAPVVTGSVSGPRDVAAALVAYALLEVWRAPPWAVVALATAAGRWAMR